MVDKNDEEYEYDINDICRALEFLYCNEEEEEDEINKTDEIPKDIFNIICVSNFLDLQNAF